MFGYWLQLNGDSKELERAILGRGQGRIKHERGGEALRHSHGVAGDGGEIGKERAETVNGQAVGGALGCGLVIGSFGTLRLSDDGVSGGIGGGLVMIIK